MGLGLRPRWGSLRRPPDTLIVGVQALRALDARLARKMWRPPYVSRFSVFKFWSAYNIPENVHTEQLKPQTSIYNFAYFKDNNTVG